MKIVTQTSDASPTERLTFPALLQLKSDPQVKVWAFKRDEQTRFIFSGVIVSAGTSKIHKEGNFENCWNLDLWEYSNSTVNLTLCN